MSSRKIAANAKYPSSEEDDVAFWEEFNADHPRSRLSYLMEDSEADTDDWEQALDDVPQDPCCPEEKTFSELDRLHILVEDGKYDVISKTGAGTFGVVFKVRDKNTDQVCALKVLRSKWCLEAASADVEYEFGWKLTEAEREAGVESRIVRFLKPSQGEPGVLSVGPEQLPGILMEALDGPNVWDLVAGELYAPFVPFHWQTLYFIAKQVCEGVAFLHSEKVVHTDLKSENVVLVFKPNYIDTEDSLTASTDQYLPEKSQKRMVRSTMPKARLLENPTVKIIDLGNIMKAEDELFGQRETLINSRPYRGPEVMLRKGWDFKSDIWSLAMTLFEMYTGYRMFDVNIGAYQQFLDMEANLGKMPRDVLKIPEKLYRKKYREDDFGDTPNPSLLVTRSAKIATRFAKKLGARQYEKTSKDSENHLVEALEKAMRRDCYDDPSQNHSEYFNLLRAMLQYDPEMRPDAEQVLQHRFFAVGKDAFET